MTTYSPFDHRTRDDQALSGDEVIRRLPFGPLFLALIGTLLVAVALFLMQWPIDPNTPTAVGPHLSRITTAPNNEPLAGTVSRIILNVGIYIILLITTLTVIASIFSQRRGITRTLMLMSGLGLLYLASMALYTSGAVAICGFQLILFSAFLSWGAAHRLEHPPLSNTADSLESVES